MIETDSLGPIEFVESRETLLKHLDVPIRVHVVRVRVEGVENVAKRLRSVCKAGQGRKAIE